MITGWRSALFSFGYNVSQMTSDVGLEAFISKVRPVDCGIELIRIGGEADGGYLIPNDLEGIEYCFSPGSAQSRTSRTNWLTCISNLSSPTIRSTHLRCRDLNSYSTRNFWGLLTAARI